LPFGDIVTLEEVDGFATGDGVGEGREVGDGVGEGVGVGVGLGDGPGEPAVVNEYAAPLRAFTTFVLVDELNAIELFCICILAVPPASALNVTLAISWSPVTGVVLPLDTLTEPLPPVLCASMPNALLEPSIDTNCNELVE
jgi:hypothetical protein